MKIYIRVHKGKKIQDMVGSHDLSFVFKDGKLKLYNSPAEAYHAAQQNGGTAISSYLRKYEIYEITEENLKLR